jgi:H+/Cl- antiporter ClcA
VTESRATSVDAVAPTKAVHPYVHVVVIAFIGAVSVLAWLIVFEAGMTILWENEYIVSYPWLIPVICLTFSLAAGLLVKYRDAPTCLNESMSDSLTGDVTRIDWRTLPTNVVMAFVSLFSGAALGPEGGIGGIAAKLAILYADKVGLPVEERSRLVYSTIASAYNGLVANPLFTTVLGTDMVTDADAKKKNLPANLIGGTIGFLVFYAVGSSGLYGYLDLDTTQPLKVADALVVVPLALVGLAMGLVLVAFMRIVAKGFERLKDRPVERALVGGGIFSIAGIFAPVLLFSGEVQIKEVVADPAGYGILTLVGMALAKLALLAVAFRGGFLGGPIFPAVFATTCVALAVGLVLPGIRSDVLVGAVMAGMLVVVFQAPLMVIVLTTVMLQATPSLIALITLAAATSMVVVPYIQGVAAARRHEEAQVAATPAPA